MTTYWKLRVAWARFAENLWWRGWRFGCWVRDTRLTLRHGKYTRQCPQCNGAGEYYNSYDVRCCEVCGGKGYHHFPRR